MFRRVVVQVRRQPVAFIALFFALGGGAMAAPRFLASSDQITQGDLSGSTYGDPVIASGAVSNDKLANSSLTITPGNGLTGGGSLPLGGTTALGVADGGIGAPQLADGAVTTEKFDPGAVAPEAARLKFTTVNDATGLSLDTNTTYFVDLETFISNPGSTGLVGNCQVSDVRAFSSFSGAFVVPPHGGGYYTFAGMIRPQGPGLTVGCADISGNTVNPDLQRWWISPIGS